MHKQPRTYKDLPDANRELVPFNQYLRENNIVVKETPYWILIKNSFINNQLVLFTKLNKRYLYEVYNVSEAYAELIDYLEEYKHNHIYINADKDKSVPNRLHLHIKL